MNKGTITNRKAFLKNITNQLHRKPRHHMERPERIHHPEQKVFAALSRNELLEKFKEGCKKIHTNVVETTADSLPQVLAAQLPKDESIVIPDDPRFRAYGLSEICEGENVHIWDVDKGKENITIAEQANSGLMFSDITLAESATTVIFNDKNKARAISLLPETFIAIIPASTIVPRMTQAVEKIDAQARNGETIASCVNFISGPSNSADIEYNLVVGVHGPIKATYVVVTDR